jgi:hypothetical protein
VTLIERYVGEVSRRVSRRQRADITRELKSTLLDALESRFGPAASEEDAATLLREFGPPQALAASYQPSSQYLIGPDWYPTFSLVWRIHLMALLGVLVVGAGILVMVPASAADVAGGFWRLVSGLLYVALLAFGSITLTFHLLERGDVRSRQPAKTWNPHDLPATRERDFIGRGEAATVVVFAAVGLVLLHQFKAYIGVWWGGDAPLLNNVVQGSVWWLSAICVLTMALYGVLAFQGRWHWHTRLSKLLLDVLFLYVVYRLGSGVIAEQDALVARGLPPNVVAFIVRVAFVTPLVMAAFLLFDGARTLFRAWRDRESASAPNDEIVAGQRSR